MFHKGKEFFDQLNNCQFIMKFSHAVSRVKWLNSEKTNVLKIISVLVLRVFSPFNHLTWLTAQENFIILSRWESNRSHNYQFFNKDLAHWSWLVTSLHYMKAMSIGAEH
jgi:hypothetical protein